MHKNTFWRLIFLLSLLLTLPINIFAQNSKPQNSQLIVKYKNTPQKIKPSLSKKLLNIPITPLDYISKEKNLNLSNLKGLENMVVYDIKNNKQDQIITELKKNPNVDFVEENGIREIMATPYDPYYYNGNYYQWAYKNGFLPMESVWDNQNASSSAVLAILDTGVNINHEDLQDRIWINSTEVPNNGIDDDQNGYIDDINGWNTYADNNNVMDDFVHGTGVAAVAMATTNNNKGIAGMAWHGKIMVLKINISNSGYISISSELEALNYAAGFSQVRVINMSFGSNGGFSSEAQAIRSLVENNHITLIAAAGNDPNKKLTYPARYPGVIAVGLYNRNGIASSLTSRGAGMDVVAPGDDIYTASNNGGYMSLDGTSFAAPYVSGFAMLLAQNNENLSAGEIATNIRTWTSTLDSVNWSQFSGFGGISPLKESLKCNDVQNTITDATLTNLLENNSPIYSDTINSSQTIDIYGKVYSTAFENYQISWADSASPSAWTTEGITLTSNQSESSERKLASFNLNVLPRDGEYVVKLEVFGDTNCNNGVLGRDNLSLPIHKVRGFAGRLIDEEGNGIASNYIPVYDTLDDALKNRNMLKYATTDSLGYYQIVENYNQFSFGDYYIKPYVDPPTNQIVFQPQYIKVDLDEQHQWVENIDFTRIFDTGFVKPDSVNLSITQGQTVKFAFTLQSTWGTNYIFDGYPTSVGSQLKFVPTSAQISEGGTAMIYLNADSAVSPGIYIGNQVLKNGEAPSLPVEFPVSITVNPAPTPTPTATPTSVPTPNCSFVGTQSASLRQGVSGYFGVEDTYLIKDVEAPADETNPIPALSKYIKVQDFYPKFRGLIGYNLSNLPINEDIKIDRAKLIINTIQWDGVANKQINIANLRKNFSETFANWTFANKLNSYSWGGLGASLTQGINMDYSLSYASSAGWGANTIDVTTQAQEWFTNKNNSHFDILLFANDSSSKWLASSENTDISKRPQLDIQYSCLDYKPNPTPTPTPIADCNFTEQRELVLQQGLDNYLGTQDTYISSVIEDSQTVPVRALSQNIKVENWWQYLNGLLSFDLYGMPKENGIVIDEASLKLWVVAWGGVQGQVEFSRIIKPFDEYFSNWSLANKTLSWSNAGASGLNADIVLSQTQAITWGENTINAKTLVENWFQNRDSNQFAIRLNAPMISGVPRLGDSFASSNYSDVNKRPKLTIKYSCNN